MPPRPSSRTTSYRPARAVRSSRRVSASLEAIRVPHEYQVLGQVASLGMGGYEVRLEILGELHRDAHRHRALPHGIRHSGIQIERVAWPPKAVIAAADQVAPGDPVDARADTGGQSPFP